ncbi:MAG: acyltransferase [Desulfarculus sp.]|nr:acyltransferase [Desulfarculus sp.]
MAQGGYKVGKALKQGGGFKAYQDLVLGTRSLGYLLLYEAVMLLSQWVPGALGLFLRKLLYPLLLGDCGKGCLFGRGVGLRHPRKIHLGQGVVVDDHALLDAKGQDNRGLFLSDGVFIGRNTIVYTKGGDIELARGVNISHNCELFSSNLLSIGAGTFIAAYSYLLSGGEYDIDSPTPFAMQSGTDSRGPTRVGADVWIAAHVVVADGSTIGDSAVVGAGSVVRGQIPPASLAAGAPAKVIRSLERRP